MNVLQADVTTKIVAGPISVHTPTAPRPVHEDPAIDKKSTHILVFHSDLSSAGLLQTLLSEQGYEVTAHTDQLSAWTEYCNAQRPFSLVLVDNTAEGVKLIQDIKARFSITSVLLLAGASDSTNGCLADEVLKVPCRSAVLLYRVDALLKIQT